MNRLLRLLSLPKRAKAEQVGTTPHDVVFAENKWKLLRYQRGEHPITQRAPLLLVPSIVNPHYVLDLEPHKSVAAFFVAAGFDTYCIDWGRPAAEDRLLSFDDVAYRYVQRAIRRAARLSGSGEAHVLGYCLGGTFSAICAALDASHMASLTLLAAPIDFSDEGLLRTWTTSATFDVRALVDAFGLVPAPLMKVAFRMLRPTLKLARYVHLADKFDDDDFVDTFFALERWGRDTESLPGEFYVSLIERLYQDNQLVKGELSVAGRPVNLADIHIPVCVLSFAHDTIAPPESCTRILDRISSERVLHLHKAGSHVGGPVSARSLAKLWPQVAAFLQ